MKNNMRQLPGIAAFSDEFRDSLRGHGYEGKGTFVCGRSGYEDGIRFGLAGGVEHPQLVLIRPIRDRRYGLANQLSLSVMPVVMMGFA